MATYTNNYNLIKPTYAETADIVPLNNNFEKIDEVMHASQTSLAPAYDQTASYQPGDVVMYELNMYKCTGATSGAWDPSKWTRTTAAETGGGGSVDFDIYGEASGTAEASFSDGAEASLVECEIGIVPTQDLHGYSKPWAGGAGKNKLENTATTTSRNGLDFTVYPDGSVLVNGTATASTELVLNTNAIPTEGNYIITGCPEGGTSTTYWLNYKVTINGVSNWRQEYGSGRTENNATIQNVGIYIYNGAVIDNLMFYPMIRESTAPSGFEPYSNICPISGHTDVTVTVASTSGGSGDDTTVSLGRTVYGGTLDVTTGELTVTHGYIYADGSFNVSNVAYGSGVYYTIVKNSIGAKTNNPLPISDKFKSESVAQAGNCYITYNGNYLITVLPDQTADTIAKATQWFSDNPTQFVYDLATPQTFNLTPTQVETLLGQNYVSHDGGGTISLVYIKKDSTIIPNSSDAEVPLTGLEISGKGFKITDARIPAPPTTNGAYVLTVTVTGGTPTYSWENA